MRVTSPCATLYKIPILNKKDKYYYKYINSLDKLGIFESTTSIYICYNTDKSSATSTTTCTCIYVYDTI